MICSRLVRFRRGGSAPWRGARDSRAARRHRYRRAAPGSCAGAAFAGDGVLFRPWRARNGCVALPSAMPAISILSSHAAEASPKQSRAADSPRRGRRACRARFSKSRIASCAVSLLPRPSPKPATIPMNRAMNRGAGPARAVAGSGPIPPQRQNSPLRTAQQDEEIEPEEFADPLAPARQALWEDAIARLHEIDPDNPNLAYFANPGLPPSQAALDRLDAALEAAAIKRVTEMSRPAACRWGPLGEPSIRELASG